MLQYQHRLHQTFWILVHRRYGQQFLRCWGRVRQQRLRPSSQQTILYQRPGPSSQHTILSQCHLLPPYQVTYSLQFLMLVWCLGVWCLELLTIFCVCSILPHFRASFFCQRHDCKGCGTSMVRWKQWYTGAGLCSSSSTFTTLSITVLFS